jgi:hypothetical protein
MRLAGQAKAGFYPAAPEAVDVAIERLRVQDANTPMLDPCAGKGAALARIAKKLNVSPGYVYAIELDEGRGRDLQTAYMTVPRGNVLTPASFEGCRATHSSFSFMWVNPPYDNEMGGGRRLEYAFLQRATGWLRPHGVLALIVPEGQTESRDIQRQLATWYEQLSIRPFPEQVRHYNEVIVLGVKRGKPADDKHIKSDWLGRATVEWGDPDTTYDIPQGEPPAVFQKVEYTPTELLSAMGKSPLRKRLQPPPEMPLPSPPLALGTGHIALLLAAGHLDGVVRPDGEAPHVVRGTASKVKYLAHEEAKENADGSVTSIEKWAEKIILTVRAVDGSGEIKTFAQE